MPVYVPLLSPLPSLLQHAFEGIHRVGPQPTRLVINHVHNSTSLGIPAALPVGLPPAVHLSPTLVHIVTRYVRPLIKEALTHSSGANEVWAVVSGQPCLCVYADPLPVSQNENSFALAALAAERERRAPVRTEIIIVDVICKPSLSLALETPGESSCQRCSSAERASTAPACCWHAAHVRPLGPLLLRSSTHCLCVCPCRLSAEVKASERAGSISILVSYCPSCVRLPPRPGTEPRWRCTFRERFGNRKRVPAPTSDWKPWAMRPLTSSWPPFYLLCSRLPAWKR